LINLKLIVEGFQRRVLIRNVSVHNKSLIREIERERETKGCVTPWPCHLHDLQAKEEVMKTKIFHHAKI
jgi:hypothetical protein